MKNKSITELVPVDDIDKNVASEILGKHPALKQALLDFSQSYESAIGKLRAVVLEIRKAKLTPYQQTCVLATAGFHKGRISEIKKIANDTEPNVQRFIQGDVSFRLAYKNAREGAGLPPTVVHPPKNAMTKCGEFIRSLSETDLPQKKSVWETWHFGCLIRIQFRPGKPVTGHTTKKKAKKAKAQKKSGGPELPLVPTAPMV